ncbi:MAG: nitroreductase family protein [Candidatus Bipolaricaulia bacterium]
MEVKEAIRGRRSIRKFQERRIDDRLLVELVEAGTWAPTGGNAQTCVFIIVREPELIEKIKLISPGMLSFPAAIIAVCQDKEAAYEKGGELGRDIMSIMDAALASQNIMLLAFAEGVGSCPVLSFHRQGLQRLLGLPEQVVPELLITLGYPAESPRPPERKLEGVYFFERYGQAG